MLVITWSSSLNLPYKLVLTDDVINHHLLRAADVPPDKLEAECSLPAAVQPELGALVRGVSGPGCGGGCPAHLAGAGTQHLAFIEHHPESEWDQLGAQRRAAVDGAVGDGGRGGRVIGERHPPAAPPQHLMVEKVHIYCSPVAHTNCGGWTRRRSLGPLKLYEVSSS